MRPNKVGFAVALWLLAAPAFADPAGDLAAVRQQCIAAAAAVQQRERGLAVLQHAIELLGQDAAGRQRDLDQSRVEQERLIGMLEHLARPPVAVPEAAIDRSRGELLVKAAVPGLAAQAKALAAEFERVAALHREIDAKRREVAAEGEVLATERGALAACVIRRREVARAALPADAASEAAMARLGREAGNLGDLITRADTAVERADKDLLARARKGLAKAKAEALTLDAADPTRPAGLRALDPPQSALLLPVSGTIGAAFGAPDAAGKPSEGLSLAAAAGSEVVAPFDGRVVYAGPAGGIGVVLIIKHGDGYHSVLAGLARADLMAGDWVLAGEPVGAMGAAPLYFELRRDGRPVDPQPWLAKREDGRGREIGDQRVRE